uniref:Calcium-transporting ATPase n=1 Tax=Solanum tuberosum TaxID=4113 RepID=M1DT14_SOLTU
MNNITTDFPAEIESSNKKRWHLAFATIYCSRAFKNKVSPAIVPSYSHGSPAYNPTKVLGDTIAIDVVQDHPFFSGIDHSSLAKLVKDKNTDELADLGGVQGVAASLKTDTTNGVSGDPEDVARRHEAFGSNMYRKAPAKSFFIFVWESFKYPTIIVLLIWGALSIVLGIKEDGVKEGWCDGGGIYVAVLLFVTVSSTSHFRQTRQFDKLSKETKIIQVEAVRKGRRQQISIFEIVVGDVICLKIGDQVPADGILVQGHSLQVDESSMTGESDHVEINISQNPFLISGTKVVDGYGMMLVTSVNMNTTWGEMMSEISSGPNEHTPLQERLEKLTSSIDKVGWLVAFLVFVVQLVLYFTGTTKDENGNKKFNRSKTSSGDVINAVVGIVANAVIIVVVAIPEGLPLAITLTLAYLMKRMMDDKAIVRKLSACETMGSATIICTDKTGTLTLNKMTVTKFFLGIQHVKAESHTTISAKVLELFHQGVGLNTTGSVFKSSDPSSNFEFSGSPTEKAILSWAVTELNMEMDQIKRNFNILHVEAFNSEKKKSGVLIKNNSDGTIHAHWKGAAEMISRMCSHYYDLEGNVKPLEESDKEECDRIIEGMAASSLRCIAFAHKQVPKAEQEDHEHMHGNVPDNSIILLGFLGLKDPCRPGMKKAVEDCQNAGVKIKMITGDNVFTAKAMAEIHTSISAKVLELFHQGVGLNTTGSVFKSSDPSSNFEFSGSPTEKAILSWAVTELNMEMDQIKRNFNILHVEAFNSEKKKSGVLIKNNSDGTIHAHWKGAAEMISRMCSHYYDLEGNVKPLEESDKEECDRIIEGMAASSLRCIAFAHKQVPKAEQKDNEHMHGNVPDNSFILLGFVGLKDPCRPGVKKAVEACQSAGVNIKMITGDNVFTAKAIATECGILHPNQEVDEGEVIEGEEFRSLTDEERMERVEKICVMARSSPFDKLLMVQCLRKKGHVVAVTGDGANDAPALKEADIGLSMGIQGTEVAKESSDIVILDANFASVVTILKWGRCFYINIQKFIQFQLTANVAALMISFVAAVLSGEEPLTSVQLLWVNLIMDTLGALALATEKPTEEVMKKKPVGRTAPLITNIMWRNLMAQASYQIAVLSTLQFKGESIFGVSKKVNDTLFFNTFVLCQVFNEFNARNLEEKNVFKGIHKNKLFMAIIGITLVLQVVMVEFLKKFANTERLNWGQWGICIGFAAASWPIGWLVKCINVPERPIFSYLRLK